MSTKTKLWNLLKNGGLFIIFAAITFKIFIINGNVKEITSAISHVNLGYIAMGIGAMLLMVFCEALNIKRCLKQVKEDSTLFQCIQYSFAGVFFSSITPAATGGQPMQIYFMHKRKIKISNAMLAIMISIAAYQLVTSSMAIISLIFNLKFFNTTLGEFSILLYLGIFLNMIFLFLLLIAIFSKKLIYQGVNLCVSILKKFNAEKAEIFKKNALTEIERYKQGAECIKNDKKFIIETIIIVVIQIAAFHSVPYWVYKAFGLSSGTLLQFIGIQAALYIAGAALPFPGAVGIGEGGFLIFFKTLFPVQLLSSAMILSRGISFYLMILISGLGVMYLQLKLNKNTAPIINLD